MGASESRSTDRPEPSSDDPRERELRELLTVILMSITAILTAWCGFEASKWGGEMSIAFSEASSARTQAANFEGAARDARQFDLTIYAQWAVAAQSGNQPLADYVQSRFTPEFAVAFDAWVEDGMQENAPFARPEYVPEGTDDARHWNARADSRFADALTNNQRGDNYSILTVLFALVLFIAALSQRMRTARAGRVLLGLAVVAALTSSIIMFTFPIKI